MPDRVMTVGGPPAAPAAPARVTPDGVLAALKEVLDPEYPISIVDLGLIRGVEVDGTAVRLRLTYTSMGCPCMDMIHDDVRARLLRLDGVERVEIETVWEPWSRHHITDEGWRRLRSVGVV